MMKSGLSTGTHGSPFLLPTVSSTRHTRIGPHREYGHKYFEVEDPTGTVVPMKLLEVAEVYTIPRINIFERFEASSSQTTYERSRESFLQMLGEC